MIQNLNGIYLCFNQTQTTAESQHRPNATHEAATKNIKPYYLIQSKKVYIIFCVYPNLIMCLCIFFMDSV